MTSAMLDIILIEDNPDRHSNNLSRTSRSATFASRVKV